MIDPHSLRCFVEGARLKNFRAGARAVALSPAAFSQRIRQLEESLGCELFRRTTRTVLLTEKGAELLPRAQQILSELARFEATSRDAAEPPPTELTIGTRHELGLSWLVPMLPRLRKEHPWLSAHVYFGSGEDLLLRVRSLAIDCAVTSSRIADPKIAFVELHEERYCFIGSKKLLDRQPLRSAADTRHHTLIDTVPELPLFRYLRDACSDADRIAFPRISRMGTIAAIRTAVLRGEGVAVLPEYFVRRDLAAGRLRIAMPRVTPLSDHFRLVHRADDPRAALIRLIADSMRRVPLA